MLGKMNTTVFTWAAQLSGESYVQVPFLAYF
jgi:hypothetical protein